MRTQQVALVRQTWDQVKSHADTVADTFYARLFEMDPTLRFLFKGDMRTQGRTLTSTIALAVASLDRFEGLLPAVRELGRRHAGYGVRDEHYATVGAALLDTLEAGLKDAFTPDVKAAWSAMYSAIAAAMKQGARGLHSLDPANSAAAEACSDRETAAMIKQLENKSPRDTRGWLVTSSVELDRHMERAHRLRARYLRRIAKLFLGAFLRWGRQRAIGMDAGRKTTVLVPFGATTHD